MIKVVNLTKKYDATVAVDDISFEVHQNEILGFLGPNGAGKSTTLKMLTGYIASTAGDISVNGFDVFDHPKQVKQAIGYLPENVPLYPEQRVREYLNYRAGLKSIPVRKRKQVVSDTISRCQIDDVQHRIIGQLSKGYKQRVGLADALLGDPKLLVLDEPTIGLDPNQIRQIRELIKELGKERTIILSSHILPEVEAVCSRVLIINKGKIVGQGEPRALRASLLEGSTTIEVEVKDPDAKALESLSAIDGVEQVETLNVNRSALHHQNEASNSTGHYRVCATANEGIREAIFDAAVDNGFKLLSLSAKNISLEDVFVKITTKEETSIDSSENSVEVCSKESKEASQ